MHFIEMVLIGFGLAVDASVVAFGTGSSGKIERHTEALRLALYFGFFQFAMPVLGWYMGTTLAPFVMNIDHWIAFTLLALIGLKMLIDSFYPSEEESAGSAGRTRLLILAVATSIDALVVGFSLSFLKVDIWYPSIVFGVVTAILSSAGVYGGRYLSSSFGKRMEFFGGVILIVIGFRILYLHIFVGQGLI